MNTPVLLRYNKGDETVEIPAYYQSGLEGSFVPGAEQGAVSFLCVDPLWRERKWTAHYLSSTLQSSLSVSNAMARIDGAWNNLGNAGTGGVNVIEIARDGVAYYGGSFANWNGLTDGDNIVSLDGTTWGVLSPGLNGEVHDIVQAPNGDIYAAGAFTNAGGIATADIIASWNGSSWSNVGDPTAGAAVLTAGHTLSFARDGNLYFGGDFTGLGGDANADYIAKWSGSAWSAVDANAPNGVVRVIRGHPNGDMYIGGAFTSIGALSTPNYVAYWDGSTWNAMGTGGPTGTVRDMLISPDGLVYVVGNFAGVWRWNGASWEELEGSGGLTGGTGYTLEFLAPIRRFIPPSLLDILETLAGMTGESGGGVTGSGGTIGVGGNFSNAGGVDVPGLAEWDGEEWSAPETEPPSGSTIKAIKPGPLRSDYKSYDLHLGFDLAGTAKSAITTTVTNPGSAPAFPIFTIKRSGGTSGTLVSIHNEETGQRLGLNLPIMDGEEITIDLRPWKKTVTSDYRGNLLGKIASTSHLATWALMPGDNLIRIFASVVGSPTFTAGFRWQNQYWSVDDV